MTLKQFRTLTEQLEDDVVLTTIIFDDNRDKEYVELEALTIREIKYVDKDGELKQGRIIAIL